MFHMSSIVKPYLFRAFLIGAIALVTGITMSVMVYISTEQVRNNAVELVNHRIPVLTSINQIISDLSEQERIIYEYYATQESGIFSENFQQNLLTLRMHLSSLLMLKELKNEEKSVIDKQNDIEALVKEFHSAMLKQENNWDEIRDLLQQISSTRKAMLPTLLMIESTTKTAVDESHEITLAKMESTHLIVIYYGISIIFFSLVGAWYIRQYILTNAKNTRLALFSQHNPNPILSVNNLGEVVFSNPACSQLLQKIGQNENKPELLLPENFIQLRQDLAKNSQSSLSVEGALYDRILQININWLKSIDAYDIHIVDITERKLAEQEVNHLAFYVKETNLPNQYKLEGDLLHFVESQKALSLGLFEISQFAQMVSAVGMQTSEKIVQCLATVVAKNLPTGVNFYQVNERMFALVCLGKLSSARLEELANKVLVIAETPIKTDCGDFFIDIDFGFSNFPEHADNPDKLIQNSLTALSISTADEYNHFAMFSKHLSIDIQKDITMLDNLRQAVELDELFLVFQPQLDLASQKITGIETLVRWRHQDKIISPVDFIPLAEQSGLIVPIGKWILENACLFAKNLVEIGHQDIVIAVNISPRQFSHPDFLNTVIQTLEFTELLPQNLELEITEGVFMHNEEQMLTLLHQLKALGIQLSIDDFGTGYSSLSYLKRFPVDKLKIDQSFIRDCHNNVEDKAIVKTIVGLGKSLGLSLIAEGVEEKVHVEFLTEIACEEIQGYWFSRPLAANDLLTFLASELVQTVEAQS